MKYTYLLFTFIVCFCSCEKSYDLDYKTEPVLITESIEIVSSSELLFKAKTLGNKELNIIDYGFIFSTYGSPQTTIQVGTNNIEEEFKAEYKGEIIDGKLYRVRSYINTDKIQILGTESFIGLNGKDTPIVYDFTPKKSQLYSTIRIYGSGYEDYEFGVYINNNRVPSFKNGNQIIAKVQGVPIGIQASVKVVIDLFQFELDEKLLIIK